MTKDNLDAQAREIFRLSVNEYTTVKIAGEQVIDGTSVSDDARTETLRKACEEVLQHLNRILCLSGPVGDTVGKWYDAQNEEGADD